MKYNGNIDSCQVPNTLNTHEYVFFSYKHLDKIFYKRYIFLHFVVHITIQLYLFYNIAHAYHPCMILFALTILHRFPDLLTLIQKMLISAKFSPLDKRSTPKIWIQSHTISPATNKTTCMILIFRLNDIYPFPPYSLVPTSTGFIRTPGRLTIFILYSYYPIPQIIS